MATVFISHSSRDGDLVEAVAGFLRDEEHHDVFLDRHPEDGIRVGERWESVLYDRLHAADAVVAVVTEHHVASPWCFAEVMLARSLGRLVFPIGSERHPLLADVQGVDWLADPGSARRRLAERLRVLDGGGPVAPRSSRPLFPGLRAFELDDAPVFFGRAGETAELAAELQRRETQRLPTALMVVGASGSGKSSLVRAGLVPRLVADGWWALPPVRPGAQPLAALARAVGRAAKKLGPERPLELDQLSARLRADVDAVVWQLLLDAPADRQRLLIVVDQFEELFTLAEPDRSADFLRVLEAAAQPGVPAAVVATMRSEFVGELGGCEPAGPLRRRPYLLAPLTAAQLKTIITEPARVGRLTLSGELVEHLVTDTGSGQALPLLANVLARLTEDAAAGDRLGLADYRRIGGVQKALRQQADATLARAAELAGHPDTEIVDALLELVTVDGAGTVGARRIRRAHVPEHLQPAFELFVDARLLSSGDWSGEPELAVSHEALLSAWPRLKDAIAGRIDRLQLRRRLEQAAVDWDRADREPSMLWRGTQLQLARAGVGGSLAGVLHEFLEASADAETAARQREADIVADRVRAAGLAERDSELALLVLLAAADELAVTDAVIGQLRQTLAQHRLIWRLPPVGARVTALAVSGKHLAVADPGDNPPVVPSTRPQPLPRPGACRIQVWDLATHERVRCLSVPGREIAALALRQRGSRPALVAGIGDRVLAFRLDPASDADLAGEAVAPSFDPLGWPQPFVQAGWTRAPTASQLSTSEADRLVATSDEHGVNLLAVDPVGQPTRIGSVLRRMGHSYEARQFRQRHGLDGRPVDPVQALRWLPDGRRRAYTEFSRVIDIDSGPTNGPFERLAAVSADGALLVLSQPPVLLQIATGSERRLPVGQVLTAAFSGDGSRLAVAGRTALSVIDVPTGGLVARLGQHRDEEGDTYEGVMLNHDGSRLVCTSLGGGRSAVWDVASGQRLRELPRELLGRSPDGAAVITREFRDIVAELSSGLEFRPRADGDSVLIVAPDRRTVLVVRSNVERLEEFTVPAGRPVLAGSGPVLAATFSPDSRHILIARPDGSIEVTPSRDPDDVLAQARAHVFRALPDPDRASFAMAPAGTPR